MITPADTRALFAKKGWERIVAHQTRNVPHTGHEWLMKGAWFSSGAIIQVNPKGEGSQLIVVHAGEDGTYAIAKLPAGEQRVTAALLGSSGMGAKSNGRMVDVLANQVNQVDIDIATGEVTLTVNVKGEGEAKIDAAQVLLIGGKVNVATAADLNKAAMTAGGSIVQTFWLPVKAGELKGVAPGEYTLCVIPINGDMNDPAFLQRLQKSAEHLKVYCSPRIIEGEPKQQSLTIAVPAMQPLPPVAPAETE